MTKIIKAVNPLQKENCCGCGKQVKKSERKPIVYKKIVKKRR